MTLEIASQPAPMRPESATNIDLSENSLEIIDNFGVYSSMTPPGAWKDLYQQVLTERLRGSKTKASNFTQAFNGHRYRCILANSAGGFVITMRKLLSSIPRLREDLQLDWNVLAPLTEGTGLTIFAGQMGSGKSTTMIATLDKMGRAKRGPLGTVEDPIEFIWPGAIQREVGTHVDTFAEAIRDFVRQHRKTIMVGEIRDPETANAAVLAASSGHSVYATLHADSAADIVPRMHALIDRKYERILPGTLRGLWWQHVLRHGDNARAPLPIYESLLVTNGVRQIIQEGPEKLPLLLGEMKKQGRKNMSETAMDLVKKRLVKREEVREWIERRNRIADEELLGY